MFLKLSNFLNKVGYSFALDLLIKSAGYDDEWRDKIEEMSKNNPRVFNEYFGGEDRVYIPVNIKLDINIDPPEEVSSAISEIKSLLPDLNIELSSYIKGLVTIDGRSFKLMKFFERVPKLLADRNIENSSIDLDSAKAAFITDRRRQVKEDELIAVMSQNPHDIAKMSTERSWRSCMRLPTSGDRQNNDYYEDLFCEVKYGGFVSYIISKNDKDIKNPLARIHVRRFSNGTDSIAIPEDKVYASDAIDESVKLELLKITREFCENINKDKKNDRYQRTGGDYSDTFRNNRDIYYVNSQSILDDLTNSNIGSEKFLVAVNNISLYAKYFINLSLLSNDRLKYILSIRPYLIKFLPAKNQTRELCLIAVGKMGPVLEHIINKTPEICLAAVKQNGLALEFIKEQTPEICIAAVRQNGSALKFVKNKTPEICLAAVKNDGLTLKYVNKTADTKEVSMAAVKQNGLAMYYVRSENQTPEICLAAVKQNGLAMYYVRSKNQTPEICMAAVKQDSDALQYVISQTPEICLAAVKNNGRALKYVNKTADTKEVSMAAVKQNGLALEFVKEQTREICLAAIENNGRALKFVNRQTLEICLVAVRNDESALEFVDPGIKNSDEFKSGLLEMRN